jgi:hypothetical protein
MAKAYRSQADVMKARKARKKAKKKSSKKAALTDFAKAGEGRKPVDADLLAGAHSSNGNPPSMGSN